MDDDIGVWFVYSPIFPPSPACGIAKADNIVDNGEIWPLLEVHEKHHI